MNAYKETYLARETLDFLYPQDTAVVQEEETHIKGVIQSLVREARQQHQYFTLAVGRN